jgi:hypothetical protein
VVPPALLHFSAGILRERFGAVVRKPVFTFSFNRYSHVTARLLSKFQIARNLRAVVVASPSSVKAFILKFIEICHNLNRQKYIVLEKKQKRAASSRFTIRKLLGLADRDIGTSKVMSPEEIDVARDQLLICEQIFTLLRSSVEIMDEVDIILHPLKSELNWPLGTKDPLDFTSSRAGVGLRWSIPSHLLDAIFSCMGVPILAEVAESKQAGAIAFVNCLSRLKFVNKTSCQIRWRAGRFDEGHRPWLLDTPAPEVAAHGPRLQKLL